METRRLGGADGFDISLVGLGCNAFGRRFDEARSAPVIRAALDAGVTFFDTAEIYGDGLSEEYVGRALEGHRDEVILATKFGLRTNHVAHKGKGPGSRENAMIAIDRSLKRLKTDHVDLYQFHKPDPTTPIAETLHAMNDMVTAGKVRLIGCSNSSPAQLQEAIDAAKADGLKCFVTAQNEWSLFERDIESGLVPFCEKAGIGILPYYPLARGLLTGKYRRDQAAPAGSRLEAEAARADYDLLEALEAFAKGRGYDLLTLAVSWLSSKPVTASVIAGATRPEQIAANATAARWKLTADDYAEVDRILAR